MSRDFGIAPLNFSYVEAIALNFQSFQGSNSICSFWRCNLFFSHLMFAAHCNAYLGSDSGWRGAAYCRAARWMYSCNSFQQDTSIEFLIRSFFDFFTKSINYQILQVFLYGIAWSYWVISLHLTVPLNGHVWDDIPVPVTWLHM
jgi:hypothetical protein